MARRCGRAARRDRVTASLATRNAPVLEFLFNVAPQRLPGASLELLWSPPVLLGVALGAMAVALYLGRYLRPWRHWLPALLRASLALLMVVVLARPTLLVRAPDTAAGPLAVLLDESLSMAIADAPGSIPRGEWMEAAFAPGEGSLITGLEARFDTRVMRFAGHVRSAGDGAGEFRGAVSDPLGALLDTVGTQGGGLAGVVLVSDGGQHQGRDTHEALTRLAAAGVPVHVVGVGSATPGPDLALEEVSAPEAVLTGDTVDVRVGVHGLGLAGQQVTLAVRDNGVLVGERSLALDADPSRDTVLVPVRLDEPGLRALRVEATTGAADLVPGNNVAERLVQVRAGPARVLHTEGEPRFEVKFLRRALTGDRALALSSLVRTGDNRYLRLGIRDEDELAQGFPRRAEELFPYHVVVLGSVEAAAFSAEQLTLLEDYVARRGGSLLLLGGRRALAEGGFGDTPLARLLPVHLDPPRPEFLVAARAVLSPAGRAHPVTRALEAQPRALPLPALAVVNPVRRLKPGASVLIEGRLTDADGAPPLALLSHHRYGAGRVVVLSVRDSWRWRMHADVAPDDPTHELFWRRLLRWLTRDVPAQVDVTVTPRLAAPGQTVTVRARVRDAAWREQTDAAVSVVRTTPLGELVRHPLVFEPGADGAYVATLVAHDTGGHELQVAATLSDGSEAAGSAGALVSASGQEYRSVALGEALLERIAARTGGSYRHASSAEGLAERVARTASPGERYQRVALWNAPALLLAILALACGEWWLRRRRKLA